MELEDIVMKLVGPVEAVGETHKDVQRLQNIKVLTELVDRLMFRIANAAMDAERPEASMKAIGKHARAFLQDMRSS